MLLSAEYEKFEGGFVVQDWRCFVMYCFAGPEECEWFSGVGPVEWSIELEAFDVFVVVDYETKIAVVVIDVFIDVKA